MPEPLLVLDTHVWIWMLEGAESIGSATRERIAAASRDGALRVAAISVWELAMLESRQRVRLALPVEEWVRRGTSAPGLQLVAMSPEIAIASTRLPGEPHGDPADRLIMATARQLGAVLATRDREILRYGAEGHLRVLDASC
jgi:PIN domain nuclease of toxin-antitoxin system